jgi:hypothetical protein
MFKKLFGGGSRTPAPSPRPGSRPPAPAPGLRPRSEHPGAAALADAIRRESANDPHVGAKIGAREVLQRLLAALSQGPGRRVHAESLLTALGALAGYACQMSVRAQNLTLGRPEFAGFIVAEADGRRFFFGEAPNRFLFEDRFSVRSLAAGQATALGLAEEPNPHEVAKHVSETMGTPAFGVPRLPEGHRPAELPVVYVKTLWPALFPTVKLTCQNPELWPLLYAVAAQQAMDMAKATMPPDLLYALVMEAAAPMAKIDLDRY